MVVEASSHHDHTRGLVGERVLDLGEHRAAPVRREGAQVVAAVDDDLLDDVSGIRESAGSVVASTEASNASSVQSASPIQRDADVTAVVWWGATVMIQSVAVIGTTFNGRTPSKAPFGVEHQTGPVGLGQA